MILKLGGSAKGIATSITKYLMLHKLGFLTISSETITNIDESTSESIEKDGNNNNNNNNNSDEDEEEEEEEIEETDPDVLSLPSVELVAKYLGISLPKALKQKTEINLKRAIISCLDTLGENPDKLAVEDMIAQSVESIPTTNIDLKRLRAALNEIINIFDATLKSENQAVKNLGKSSPFLILVLFLYHFYSLIILFLS